MGEAAQVWAHRDDASPAARGVLRVGFVLATVGAFLATVWLLAHGPVVGAVLLCAAFDVVAAFALGIGLCMAVVDVVSEHPDLLE